MYDNSIIASSNTIRTTMNYENMYVASFNENEIFSLKDFTFQQKEHEFEPGEVVRLENGVLFDGCTNNELTEEQKDLFDDNQELGKLLNEVIVKNCTGQSNYGAAVWAMDFNRFMRGFCNRDFEV